MFGYKPNTLSRGVKKVLSEHAVGSYEPDLAFDFIDNEYTVVGGTKSLNTAVTHSRSGNATMTDGYGPELVTNGTFDSDATGATPATWETNNANASLIKQADGTALFSSKSFAYARIQNASRPVLPVGVYEVSFSISEWSTGLLNVHVGLGTGGNVVTGNGSYSYMFESTAEQAYEFQLRPNSGGTGSFKIDNISVREIPVLKWAPHNLLTYSEDFSNAAWNKGGSTAVSVGPDFSTVTLAAGAGPHWLYHGGPSGQVRQGIEAKAGTVSYISISSTSPSSDGAYFDLSSGSVGTVKGSDTATITDLGDGWYYCEVTFASDEQFFTLTIANADNAGQAWTASGGETVYIRNARTIRKSLGGMVDNPDRGDSYVPTTSAAAYLPRIGHHEYNGYEWVNKGLLAESESRTNAFTHSEDVTDAAWSKVSISVTADTAASPAGSQTADTLTVLATGGYRYVHQQVSLTQNETYTFSVYLKYTDTQWVWLLGETFGDTFFWFDIQNGVLGGSGGGTGNPKVGQNYSHAIEDAGNGWYRCSATFTKTSGTASEQIGFGLADADSTPQATLNQTCLSWGAQLETGSVPSSYVPTSGATATRAAETFTVPAANLPWPQPEYIGPELVTNGTFDTDTDWTKGTGWTISGGKASCDGTNGQTILQTSPGLEAGAVYRLELTVSNHVFGNIRPYVGGNNSNLLAISGNGVYSILTVAGSANDYIGFQSSASNFSIDNVSIREVNPLSVSIAMKGEMDYADTGDTELTWYYWFASSGNYVQSNLRAQSTATGELYTLQAADSVADDADGRYSQYAPGLNVPFDIAARHGSTFVNGAAGGVALTADTTPTALPDLSATDLDLASDFMGTIESFRVWDQDLGDSGIEEASAPSLEPSLNLTFDGSGLSFTDTGWTP